MGLQTIRVFVDVSEKQQQIYDINQSLFYKQHNNKENTSVCDIIV